MTKTNTYSATEAGSSRSVRLRDLEEFYSTFETFIGQRGMFYIVSNIIKPLTQPLNLSFAEMAGPCSGPYFYVSEAWVWEFSQVMSCLGVHSNGTDARYWMSGFSLCHYRRQVESPDSLVDFAFHKALSSPLFQGLVVPFQDLPCLREYLRRSWCLLELFIAFTQNSSGINSNHLDLERVSFCAPSGILNRGQCSPDSPDMCMECVKMMTHLDLHENLDVIVYDSARRPDMHLVQSYVQEAGGWDEFYRILSSSFKKIIESVEDLASLHADRVKSQLLLRNFSQLLQRRGSDTFETCRPGPERSISAGQLDELQKFFASVLDDRAMYWVCDEIVKPLTEQKQVSYAELVGCGMVRWSSHTAGCTSTSL